MLNSSNLIVYGERKILTGRSLLNNSGSYLTLSHFSIIQTIVIQ